MWETHSPTPVKALFSMKYSRHKKTPKHSGAITKTLFCFTKVWPYGERKGHGTGNEKRRYGSHWRLNKFFAQDLHFSCYSCPVFSKKSRRKGVKVNWYFNHFAKRLATVKQSNLKLASQLWHALAIRIAQVSKSDASLSREHPHPCSPSSLYASACAGNPWRHMSLQCCLPDQCWVRVSPASKGAFTTTALVHSSTVARSGKEWQGVARCERKETLHGIIMTGYDWWDLLRFVRWHLAKPEDMLSARACCLTAHWCESLL